MADAFLGLTATDRREVLDVAADRSGRPAHLLEKDVWVVRTLAALYGSHLGEHLVFKGGTSLSKAYGVIRRFSEDVDLTYDIRALAPDLVGDIGEALPKTRSEEKRWSSEVRKRLPEWVVGAAQPTIANALAREGLAAAIRVEDDKLFIDYEATATGSGYVAPSVMLEFGARRAWWTQWNFPPRGRVSCTPSGRFGKRRRRSMFSACRHDCVATGSRVIGTMSRGWMMPAWRPLRLRIESSPRRSRATKGCFSPKRRPTAHPSITRSRSTAACALCPMATR